MSADNQIVLLKFRDNSTLSSINYANFAEKRIISLKGDNGRFGGLTTSKLRSIYALIMNIYTRVNVPEDFQTCISDLQYLQIKLAYESGRDRSVHKFIKETLLMEAIKYIKSYEQFIVYCRYAESLVAYFKFYGGRDK